MPSEVDIPIKIVMMNNLFNKASNYIAVLISLPVFCVLGNVSALAIPSSSYHLSCTDIGVDGDILSATCKTKNGAFTETSIQLMGIENIDGTLVQKEPSVPSTFQQTCSDQSIEGNILTATCLTRDQQPKTTSVELGGIENIDGVLEYTYTGN